MSAARYSEYKDSIVEWLGEVPEHWGIWKLSRAVQQIGSGTTPNTGKIEYYEAGHIPWLNTGDLNDGELFDCAKRVTSAAITDHSILKLYPSGTVVIAMYGATIGKLSILRFSATVNQACCVFAGDSKIAPKFLFYWLLGFRKRIISMATGGGQPNINQEILRSLRISFPDFDEQSTIIAFLDRETAKIDTLVEEQQKLIALLKEKRQAVISHAVTKGLDPNVPMKDSGIEWLGEVPKHWESLSLKYLCSTLRDGTHNPPQRVDDGYPLLSVRNIIDDKLVKLDDDSLISESDFDTLNRSFVIKSNDVLLAIVGATLGKTAVVDEKCPEFTIQRSLALFRTNAEKLTPAFLYRYLQSSNYQRFLWENAGYSAQPGIYLGTLANSAVLCPPLNEQVAVSNMLEKVINVIDSILLEAQQSINLLKERRNALISAAVTGKIDIRELVAEEVTV